MRKKENMLKIICKIETKWWNRNHIKNKEHEQKNINIWKKQIKLWRIKDIVIKIENSKPSLNRILDTAAKRINKPEEKPQEIK